LHDGYSAISQDIARLIAEDPVFGELQKNNPAYFDEMIERFITEKSGSQDILGRPLTGDEMEAIQFVRVHLFEIIHTGLNSCS
jgi:hypothetical protein